MRTILLALALSLPSAAAQPSGDEGAAAPEATLPSSSTDTPVDALPQDLRDRFIDAEAAWQSGRLDEAAAGFDAITEAAPTFDRAWRRACGVRVQQRQYTRAVPLCDEAASLKASKENRTGLAIARIHAGSGQDEARDLIDEVLDEDPSYTVAWQALCSYALEYEDEGRLRRCVTGLEAHTPTAPAVPLFQALLQATEGEFDAAWAKLEVAAGEGVSEAMLASMRARVAGLQAAAPTQRAGTRRAWQLADLAPIAIVLLLVGGIAVLALSDNEDDDASDDGPSKPDPTPTA